jgi:hypothetical protein
MKLKLFEREYITVSVMYSDVDVNTETHNLGDVVETK